MNEITTVKDHAAPASVNTNASGMLNIIAEAARDPSYDLDRMRALFEMQQKVLEEESRRAYMAAMAKAQSEIGPIVRDAQNKHTGNRYARLEAIDRVIRPIYTNHDLSLVFDQREASSGEICIVCTVSHAGGYEKTFTLNGKLDAAGAQGNANKTAIQAVGSTISYLRRYLTCMIFNIALTDEDQDGNRQKSVPQGTINTDQFKEIMSLIEDTKADARALCEFYQVEKVADLTVAAYADVRGRLLQKKARKHD